MEAKEGDITFDEIWASVVIPEGPKIVRETICGGDVEVALNLWLVLRGGRPGYLSSNRYPRLEIRGLTNIDCYYVRSDDREQIVRTQKLVDMMASKDLRDYCLLFGKVLGFLTPAEESEYIDPPTNEQFVRVKWMAYRADSCRPSEAPLYELWEESVKINAIEEQPSLSLVKKVKDIDTIIRQVGYRAFMQIDTMA